MNKIIKTINSSSSPQTYLNTLFPSVLDELKVVCDNLYYNTSNEDGISDENYDLLLQIIEEKKGYKLPLQIGAKVPKHFQETHLPYYLGSMNKIKTEHEITKWIKKYTECQTFIIQEKLDGVSCLFYIDKDEIKLFTRGDGLIGNDISYHSKLIPSFANIDLNLLKKNDIYAIRGELIIKKSIFNKKYSGEFSNPRNTVSGLINSKTIKKEIADVEFVVYEIVNTSTMILKEQFNILQKCGFTVVKHEEVKTISLSLLTKMFIEWKIHSDFEIDGLICHVNTIYNRNTSGNPSYAFAFKMLLETIETEVEDVIWKVTKWRVLKPRVKVKEVKLSGVLINYATGFNAKYIIDNNIGKGAIVRITRSNDVIPYILSTVKKSNETGLPDVDFEWRQGNEYDIYLSEHVENDEDKIRKLVSFFGDLKIKFVSESTVTKMFNHGLNTLPKILNASVSDLMKIETIQKKSAERIYENIHTGLLDIPIPTLLGASCVFGFGMGRRKIEQLFKNIPDLFEIYKHDADVDFENLYEGIKEVEGFSDKSALKIIEHIPEAIEFLSEILPFLPKTSSKPVTISKQQKSETIDNRFEGMKILFSGYRDGELEKKIEKYGGKIVSSISKNTSMLIVGTKSGEPSSKMVKAKELKIPIMTGEEFISKYKL